MGLLECLAITAPPSHRDAELTAGEVGRRGGVGDSRPENLIVGPLLFIGANDAGTDEDTDIDEDAGSVEEFEVELPWLLDDTEGFTLTEDALVSDRLGLEVGVTVVRVAFRRRNGEGIDDCESGSPDADVLPDTGTSGNL